MLQLIEIELYKIFRKWRSYIGFIAIGVLGVIIQIAMLFEGQKSLDFMTQNLRDSFVFVGNLLNGFLISYLILNMLTVHIPFLIALVAGDLLAGEATAGTYRILLTRPVSRLRIVSSKFIAGNIYTFLLILWLAIVSMGVGAILFGFGELIVIRPSGVLILDRADVLWRFLLAYGFAVLGMSVVCSLALFFSSLVENAIGPIVSTMAVIIVFIIVSEIKIDLFKAIRPYLFTNYILSWRMFFSDPVNISKVLEAVMILFGHIIFLFSITAIIFKRKDILS
ncbi:MAG: ABC transporter permease subunit [Ignavibacteria bacterium]|nr:ABC transporter permease subunit [Ignavibacteria bacterium]